MSQGETVLLVRNLSKIYYPNRHAVHALNNVSFSLGKGEMLAVMGTSGSGKTTLLNLLGALDEPTSGDILIRNAKPANMFVEPHATHYRRENIGFIFQSFQLLKDLTVAENVALPLILKGMPDREVRGKVEQMLGYIGLEDRRAHRPVELSGGQQQRVAIGRALIASPPVVLADEPTGNLDYNTSRDILGLFVDMKKRFDQSMVIVTHDPMVASYADRVLIFHNGKIVDEYRSRYRHEDDINEIVEKFKQLVES